MVEIEGSRSRSSSTEEQTPLLENTESNEKQQQLEATVVKITTSTIIKQIFVLLGAFVLGALIGAAIGVPLLPLLPMIGVIAGVALLALGIAAAVVFSTKAFTESVPVEPSQDDSSSTDLDGDDLPKTVDDLSQSEAFETVKDLSQDDGVEDLPKAAEAPFQNDSASADLPSVLPESIAPLPSTSETTTTVPNPSSPRGRERLVKALSVSVIILPTPAGPLQEPPSRLSLTSSASTLQIEPVQLPTPQPSSSPSPAASSSSPPSGQTLLARMTAHHDSSEEESGDLDANTELSLQLLHNYEVWIRRIAREDFGIEQLPKEYVQAKINDFLDVYAEALNRQAGELSAQDFIDQVFAPIYDLLHSQENRRQLVEELTRLQQVDQVKRQPADYVQALLANEFGETNAHEMMQTIAAEVMEMQTSGHIDMVRMETLQEQMRSVLNGRALITLRDRLNEEIGTWSPDLVDQIMNDWGYIGIDVKYNRGFLSAERIEMIVQRAQQLYQHMDQMDTVLEGLRNEINQGMPISEELIERRYGDNLAAVKKAMPQAQRDRIQRQFVQILTMQQAKKLSQFNGGSVETRVLEALGYDLERYSERVELRDEMLAFLTAFSTNESAWRKSIPQLKKEIGDHAFQVRMRLAGVPENCAPYIKEIVHRLGDLRNPRVRAIGRSTATVAEVEAIHDLSLRRGYYKTLKNKAIETLENLLFQFVRNHQTAIRDMMQTGGDFRTAFTQFSEAHLTPDAFTAAAFLENQIDPQMRKQMQWSAKYEHRITRPFQQHGHAALGRGVCLAYSTRLNRTVLFNPACTLDELQVDRLTPQDRHAQAGYSVRNRTEGFDVQDVRGMSVPGSTPLMAGAYPQPVYATLRQLNPTPGQLVANAEALASNWIANLDKLQASNGGFSCLVAGHAIPVRIDVARNEYWFSDPNFGYQPFTAPPRAAGQTDDEYNAVIHGVIREMALCMEELVDAYYSDTTRYLGSQLLAQNPAVVAPESSYLFQFPPEPAAAASSV